MHRGCLLAWICSKRNDCTFGKGMPLDRLQMGCRCSSSTCPGCFRVAAMAVKLWMVVAAVSGVELSEFLDVVFLVIWNKISLNSIKVCTCKNCMPPYAACHRLIWQDYLLVGFFGGWIFPVFQSGFCGLGIPGFCELCLLVGFCCFWLLAFLHLCTIPQPFCRHQPYRGLKTGQQHCFIRKLACFWLLWLCHLGPLVSCVFLLSFFWVLVLLASVVSWQYAATIVPTTSEKLQNSIQQ